MMRRSFRPGYPGMTIGLNALRKTPSAAVTAARTVPIVRRPTGIGSVTRWGQTRSTALFLKGLKRLHLPLQQQGGEELRRRNPIDLTEVSVTQICDRPDSARLHLRRRQRDYRCHVAHRLVSATPNSVNHSAC